MSRLAYTVYVTDEDGKLHVFGPDSDVPDWAAVAITNPLAWEESPPTVPAPTDPEGPPNGTVSEPPPQGGPGASRQVWAEYAAANGVEVHSDWKREDIIAACEAAGVPV